MQPPADRALVHLDPEPVGNLSAQVNAAPPHHLIPLRVGLDHMFVPFDGSECDVQVRPNPGGDASEKRRAQSRRFRLLNENNRRGEYGGFDRNEQRIARTADAAGRACRPTRRAS